MKAESLPEEMTGIAITESGSPGVLGAVRCPVPRPGPGELLIRIAAAGVNRPDCLQRRGLYPPPPGASELPGLEVSGDVVAIGEGVRDDRLGEAVCALLAGGGYAEYCVAPDGQCLPIPSGISYIEAAALPEAMFTVWSNVVDRGHLATGETILVHGGASGIGTTAIMLSRQLGATVIATAGDDDKTALCRRLGADLAINYRTDRFAEVVEKHTGGRGADVILDIVGAAYLDDNVRCLAPDGRLIVIGVLGGTRATLNLGRLLARRGTITASTLRNRSLDFKRDIARSLAEHVWPALERGEIRPVIQQSIPLTEAPAAHEIIEANRAMGKIVLQVR